MSDPASLDDKPVTELHLPKGKKVLFKFNLHMQYMHLILSKISDQQ